MLQWDVVLLVILIILLLTVVIISRQAAGTLRHTKYKQITIQDILENKERRVKEQDAAKADPPEVRNLKELIKSYEKDSTQWDIIVAIGDVYRIGGFPRFQPNEWIAQQCYKIASMCPNGEIAGIAQSKYVGCRTESINNVDINSQGEALPTEYGQRVCYLAEQAIMTTPWSEFERPKAPGQGQKQARDDIPIIDFDFGMIPIVNNTNTNEDRRPLAFIMHDTQNVHDHSVTRIIKTNIDNLLLNANANTNVKDHNGDIEIDEIRAAILDQDEISPKEKADALLVLEDLKSSEHGTFKVSEIDTAKLVWNKIKQMPDKKLQENVKQTLVHQLASGVEHGHVVCSTGKITRLMSTFDGIEDIKDIEKSRPMWALREELANAAAKIRQEMPDASEDSQRAAFRENIRQEYIKKLGLSETIIQPLIELYETGF